MSTRFLTLFLFLSLQACTGVVDAPMSRPGTENDKTYALNPAPSKPGLAVVYIHREGDIINIANALVGVNQTRIVSLKEGTFTRIELPPGLHTFRYVVHEPDFTAKVTGYNSGEKTMLVKAGVANLVTLDSSDLHLHQILYIDRPTEALVHKADYLHPYRPRFEDLVARVAKTETSKSVTAALPQSTTVKAAAKPTITATEFSRLQKNAACKLKSAHWAYTANSCKQGLAHGKGTAVDTKGLNSLVVLLPDSASKVRHINMKR